jgi:hypothetical protein
MNSIQNVIKHSNGIVNYAPFSCYSGENLSWVCRLPFRSTFALTPQLSLSFRRFITGFWPEPAGTAAWAPGSPAPLFPLLVGCQPVLAGPVWLDRLVVDSNIITCGLRGLQLSSQAKCFSLEQGMITRNSGNNSCLRYEAFRVMYKHNHVLDNHDN